MRMGSMVTPGIPSALAIWYRSAKRPLVWRTRERSLYHTWLAEIMAQQTTVAAAQKYWLTFVTRWPTVSDLAAAPEEAVLQEWAGLGYYARARNLVKTARTVAQRGAFPRSEEALRALPGIGPYTARAIAAIALGARVLAVDTNVRRIAARLFATTDEASAVQALGDRVPQAAPGAFNEALMDLGATICTVRAPKCTLCPLAPYCAAYRSGTVSRFPKAQERPVKPERFGIAWWVTRTTGESEELALVRRPPKGLLGGMLALPGTEWTEDATALARYGGTSLGAVRHTFTHLHLTLDVRRPDRAPACDDFVWRPLREEGKPLAIPGLPTLYRKAVHMVRASAEQPAERNKMKAKRQA